MQDLKETCILLRHQLGAKFEKYLCSGVLSSPEDAIQPES